MSIETYNLNTEEYKASFTVEKVLVAGNRGFCGGVNMALEAANQVLDLVDGREPVFTNWDIVNNTPIMDRLKERGLINVKNNWDLVPQHSIVFFSAHGVPPQYRDIAREKNYLTIDTTCQLVSRVHSLVKSAEEKGQHVLYIGKKDHPETEGVLGELKPENKTFLEPNSSINKLSLPTGKVILVYSQTTLATNEVVDTQNQLKEKFPEIIIPNRWDICYATDNRQQAVDNLLDEHKIDFLLVAGSSHSHNSQELKRKAEKKGVQAALVDNVSGVDRSWFTKGVRVVGATSGASQAEGDFQNILDIFRKEKIDPVVYVPQVIPERDLTFKLPKNDVDALRKRMERYEN